MKYMPNTNVVKPTGYCYIFKNKLEATREKKDDFLYLKSCKVYTRCNNTGDFAHFSLITSRLVNLWRSYAEHRAFHFCVQYKYAANIFRSDKYVVS
jgi:hypothetical protein